MLQKRCEGTGKGTKLSVTPTGSTFPSSDAIAVSMAAVRRRWNGMASFLDNRADLGHDFYILKCNQSKWLQVNDC